MNLNSATMRRQIVLAIILFSCLVFVNGENTTSNTQTGPTDTSLGEESALEKGAKPLYDLVHGFLDSVQEYDFIADDSAKISKFLNLGEKKNERKRLKSHKRWICTCMHLPLK